MTGTGVCLVDGSRSVADLAGLAEQAAQLGYRTIWTNENVGRDPGVVLAAWASRAPGARLGVGVSPIFARPPLTAAAMLATAAEVAGGGLVYGVGAGHAAMAKAWFGVDLGSPVAAVREYVQVMRMLLAGEDVARRGPRYPVRARLPHVPVQAVPVVVGAMGPRMLTAAVEVADGVLLNWTTCGELARLGAELPAAAARPFAVLAYVRVAVHDDPEAARAALAADLAGYLRFDAYRAHLARQGYPDVAAAVGESWAAGRRAAAAIPAEVLGAVGIAGTADHCRRELDRYRRSGIAEVVVRPVPTGADGLMPAVAVGAPSGREG